MIEPIKSFCDHKKVNEKVTTYFIKIQTVSRTFQDFFHLSFKGFMIHKLWNLAWDSRRHTIAVLHPLERLSLYQIIHLSWESAKNYHELVVDRCLRQVFDGQYVDDNFVIWVTNFAVFVINTMLVEFPPVMFCRSGDRLIFG